MEYVINSSSNHFAYHVIVILFLFKFCMKIDYSTIFMIEINTIELEMNSCAALLVQTFSPRCNHCIEIETIAQSRLLFPLL